MLTSNESYEQAKKARERVMGEEFEEEKDNEEERVELIS